MRTTKKLTSLFLALLFALSASGCGSKQNVSSDVTNSKNGSSASSAAVQSEKTVAVAALKGPTGLSMAKLMDDSKSKKTKANYNISLVSSPDEIVSMITGGKADAAALPTNLAAALYNKTSGNVRMAAVTTLGVLYLLTSGEDISGIKDLKGKTVYLTGRGATPEYAFDYILKQNGLTAGSDVKTVYESEHAGLAAKMIAGSVKIAVLQEPFVTQVLMKNKDVKRSLDITEEWDKASGGESVLSMGCLVVSKKFAAENKGTLDTFLDEYKASASYADTNTEETAALSEKYGIMQKAVAEKAIPNCGIVYIDGDEMQSKIPAFLQILYKANPKSIGGKLPDDNFYYKK